MTTIQIVFLILFAFGASFVQRVTGFGFGIFIMTVLPFLMPSYGEATALSGLLALISALVTTAQTFRYLDWKKMFIIIPVFIVSSFFAIKAVAHLDSDNLRSILGGFLIIIGIYFFFVSSRIHLKGSPIVQVGMGALSGVTGGFFAIQGPPAVIYFLSVADSKEQYMAFISAYFVISNTMMTIFRAGNGFVTAAVGKAWLIAAPVTAIGIWVGSIVYRKIPINILRKIVYAYMAVAGLIALLS